MRPLTGSELDVLETLLAEITAALPGIETTLGPTNPSYLTIKAGAAWLKGIYDSGILAFPTENHS